MGVPDYIAFGILFVLMIGAVTAYFHHRWCTRTLVRRVHTATKTPIGRSGRADRPAAKLLGV